MSIPLASLVKNGGKIAVFGASNGIYEAWKDFPQLNIYSQKELQPHDKTPELPTNTRAIIMSRLIGHKHAVPLIKEARKRNLVIFGGKSDLEIRTLLSDIIGEKEKKMSEPIEVEASSLLKTFTIEPAKKMFENKGIRQFIQANYNPMNDYTVRGSKIQEAKRLYELITANGINTTLNTVVQEIYMEMKRQKTYKTSQPEVAEHKKEAKKEKKNTNLQLMELLDAAIENLKVVRLGLEGIQEDFELKKKLKKLLDEN